MIYERILNESQRIEKQIKDLQLQLKNYPEGKLICSQNGKYTKWYQSDGKTKIYIPKSEQNLAQKLALKKYLTLQLDNLIHEKSSIDFYLRHHDLNANQAEQALLNSPGYKELISSSYTPMSKKLSDWMNAPYERNTRHTENLNHSTYSGYSVRSKSEAFIETVLFKNKIPFRYECALHLGEITLFPDFTICHPETGQIFYWEHFGLMDDPNYAKNTYQKLQLYTSHRIIPTIQLITTFETKESPLSLELVEKIVRHYFL